MKYIVELTINEIYGSKIMNDEDKFIAGIKAVMSKLGDENKFYETIYEDALQHGISYLEAYIKKMNYSYIIEPIYFGKDEKKVLGIRFISYTVIPSAILENFINILLQGIGKYLEIVATT